MGSGRTQKSESLQQGESAFERGNFITDFPFVSIDVNRRARVKTDYTIFFNGTFIRFDAENQKAPTRCRSLESEIAMILFDENDVAVVQD